MYCYENNFIETERLTLKPIIESNFDRLFELYSNKNVMKYIYDGEIFSKKTAREKIAGFVQHWHKYGFGFWMMYLKNKQEAVGYIGFRYFEDDRKEFKNKIELGYIIDKPYWGRGYAKEGIQACVQAGFNNYNILQILATILPENIPSVRAVLHAGFKHISDAKFDGLLHGVYEIKNNN